MANEPDRLALVAEPMREAVKQYAALVRELGGENALALTFYGALAAGSFDPAVHTAANVLVLGRVDLKMLRRLSDHGLKLGKARISAPLIMTPTYIQASLDTFPLELIEIHQQHVTVFGEDCFAELVVDSAHVRLQCERELKAIMIRMRQGLLAAAGRDKLLDDLQVDIGEALARALRGLLWLKDHKRPMPASQVVAAVEQAFQRPLPGVRQAVDRGGEHGFEQFRTLYEDVEALGTIIDAW